MIPTLLSTLLLVSALSSQPSTWPQWGGPDRNFQVRQRILDQPPMPLWERELGAGHAGVVSDGVRLYVPHGRGSTESVSAIDPASGKTVWRADYKVQVQSSTGRYAGPHATPLLAGGLIVTAAVDGQIRAWDTGSGDLVWRRELVREFGSDLAQFGYASSPVRWRDTVILPGLGGDAPGAIALALEDGRTIWAKHDFLSSHSSPVLLACGAREHLVIHGRDDIVGLDPETGEMLWMCGVREDAYDNVAFSPVWDPVRSLLLVSHGYDRSGVQAIRLEQGRDGWRASKVWKNARLKIEHGNAVIVDGRLFGSAGQFLGAIDLDTGRLDFKRRGFPKSTLVAAGDDLLVLAENGEVSFVEPLEDGVRVRWSLDVLEPEAWTAPVVQEDRIILRDRRTLKAMSLAGFVEAPSGG